MSDQNYDSHKPEQLLSEVERQKKYVDQLPDDYQWPLFNAKSALESQRSSAYQNTAAAGREIVDNSIEAHAKNIHVIFESYQKNGKGKRLVKSIAFIDDGSGMIPKMARYALTWGGGTHFDDPNFIGKFGFGLPNASINQARKTEVYTRVSGDQPITMGMLDIDTYRTSFGIQKVPEPNSVEKLPSFVERYLNQEGIEFNNGTIVVWTKLDRLSFRTPAKLKEHLVDDFGVTYRYLLKRGSGINLRVEGVNVKSVDPLFLEPGCRLVPDIEDRTAQRADVVEDITIPTALIINEKTDEHELIKVENPHLISTYQEKGLLLAKGAIQVRVARFPFGFAKGEKKYRGTDEYKRFQIRKSRRGMSFVRANREIQTVDVFPKSDKDEASGLGEWPLLQSYAYHWGVEVRFKPDLDSVFGITNDKQGVRPIADFWRLLASEEIDALLRRENKWQTEIRKKNKPPRPSPEGRNRTATPAEQAANSADTATGGDPKPPQSQIPQAQETFESEAEKLANQMNIEIEEAEKILEESANTKRYHIEHFENEYGPAWEPKWRGRQIMLKINTAHPFYQDIYGKLEELDEFSTAYEIKNGIDVVLIALAKAELETEDEQMKFWYEVHRTQKWSEFIKVALKSLSINFSGNSKHDVEEQPFVETGTHVKHLAVALDSTLRDMGFHINGHIDPDEAHVGPSVIRFKVSLKSAEKLSAIQARSSDIMRELEAVKEPIIDNLPGSGYIYVDVPHPDIQPIHLPEHHGDSIDTTSEGLTIPFGMSPEGKIIDFDISELPHMLVAGTTGSGKTVFLYSVITSLTERFSEDDLSLILIDPKRTDFVYFNQLPHLEYGRVITDAEEAIALLDVVLTDELERRTTILQESMVRDIKSYNRKNPQKKLPHLVIVIDEFADLADVMNGPQREEFDRSVKRLAQRARSVGIHLILATQRPSADIVKGAIKANLPCRVSFRLSSGIDSRTILDQTGAEKLLGKGDMLVSWNGEVNRLQGFFISEEELEEKFL